MAGNPAVEFRVFPMPELEPTRPALERETFSGGRNISATERNAARREAYQKKRTTVYIQGRSILCAPSFEAELLAKIDHLRQLPT